MVHEDMSLTIASTYYLESQAPSAHGTLGCPQEIVDGVAWSRTIPGATDIKPCPDAQGTS